ncbi:DUF763 domain-containing protein [Taibaiella koreensis]|uniref:DUF763 domain-containing protein n=1 Tax=Taibaiella koreensis TaxID=1268548 RepID=UPI000E59CEEB|nr:DUF763 domain-containing protein [Taibaiella koreensis]
MSKSGYADMPLHYGKVPQWLAVRMSRLGGAISEAIVMEYGRSALLSRLSDPFWFQSLGCVLGMDWHSSGITTSVMGALKGALNKRSAELGIYICGGRGKYSLQTPTELAAIGERTGLDAHKLVQASKLSAKVDNTAIQDGFQLYLHSFILTGDGEWAVVQQGMNTGNRLARRYHWHSPSVQSFTEAPHQGIYGINQGTILNLTDIEATQAKTAIVGLTQETPDKVVEEIRRLVMPAHHDVRGKDVDMKRLGTVLALAHEQGVQDFESLLLLQGVGPRTLQSLALVSEVIHGAPVRFRDPARFSFAHGGKDGHPFPVPEKVYDETITLLETGIRKAKIGEPERQEALKSLSKTAAALEQQFEPNDRFDDWVAEERRQSWLYGGRTVQGRAKSPDSRAQQLELF